MTPVLILAIFFSARFVTWDAIKGVDRQAQQYVQEGTASLRAWKLSQAIRAFTHAIEIEPRYAEAYVKRGLAYYRFAHYESAIADYTETLALKRYQADAYASRGDAHRALGDTQRAVADYSASLKRRWNPAVLQRRAETYFDSGNVQRAIADYDTVIKRQPTLMAYYARGNTYLRLATQGDKQHLTLALADLNQTVALEPRFAGAYISRAQIYTHLGEHASATQDYRYAIELLTGAIQTWQGESNALVQLYYRRAFAHQKLGEVDKAEKDVRKGHHQVFRFLLEKIRRL